MVREPLCLPRGGCTDGNHGLGQELGVCLMDQPGAPPPRSPERCVSGLSCGLNPIYSNKPGVVTSPGTAQRLANEASGVHKALGDVVWGNK